MLFSANVEEIVRESTKLCYNEIKELRLKHFEDFAYLEAMKSPIGRLKNKVRYQILARIAPKNQDEIISKMYEICDKYASAKVSVFVEINPQNLS